jgi:hypothetical protein
MRETICTVSGQIAEAHSNKIRITNDRDSYLHSRDAAELLHNSGFFGGGVFRSPEGIREGVSDVCGQRSGVQGEAGENWTAPRSNGHRIPEEDSSLSYPWHVHLIIAGIALVVVIGACSAAWMLGEAYRLAVR